jgi:hypothetical protein
MNQDHYIKDVPVDAFWSVTVYNADGYLEANDLGVNSYNNVTAETNPDGSHTIDFGGCEDGRVNCIPISPMCCIDRLKSQAESGAAKSESSISASDLMVLHQ